jgi:hypothetical protein
MNQKNNAVGWFEVPVRDMERAVRFYEKIFGYTLTRSKMGQLDMAWFPWFETGLGSAGSLVYHEEFYKPSTDGILIYFSSHTRDLSNELSKVESSGGKILIPRTLIKEDIGYMAVFMDTEGNRVAIHSRK